MLDQSWRCSIVRKEIFRSRSIVGAIGAKDIAAVNERGGRLNLCLEQESDHFLKIITFLPKSKPLRFLATRSHLNFEVLGIWKLLAVSTHFNFLTQLQAHLRFCNSRVQLSSSK